MRNNDYTDKIIGNALKSARLLKDYSLADVADKIPEISRSSIHKFETGQRSISIDNLFSTDLLMNGVDPKTHQELMGHSTYNMSLYYANSNEEQKKKAVENR